MSRTPSFSYMGGKCNIRDWLMLHFPSNGYRYIEPFAGLGNVFFQARKDLDFQEWHLSDIRVSFFKALLNTDLNELPDKVDKKDFEFWKKVDNNISRVLEPKISFHGKGYGAGFMCNGVGVYKGYNRELYQGFCEEARRLLANVKIEKKFWEEVDYKNLNPEDFVYFDPPYLGTEAQYPNINHIQLVHTLNKANFRWALSGYDSRLYASSLRFKERYSVERNSGLRSYNSGKYAGVNEILWTNY